jgi:hypothetical protein
MDARGRRRIAALALAIAAVASGCTADHGAVVADFEAVMPVLARHEVVDFYRNDVCEFIAYGRGVFSTDPTSADCEIHVDTPGKRRAIDRETRQVLDEIDRASEAVGPRLQSATVELVGGRVASGYFDFGQDDYYRFEPGYTSMQDDDWFCTEVAVNANWYAYDC